MNPKQFLVIGGVVLVIIAILGFIGITGPTPAQSIFGSMWWFDNYENWAHLILGIVALLSAFLMPAVGQKTLVMLLGVIGLLIGIYSIFYVNFFGAMLQNPADTILHIAVGIWALIASMGGKRTMNTSGPAMMKS